MTVICSATESEKAPSVFVSHAGCSLPLNVNLSVTVMLRNQPQLSTDPVTSLYHPTLTISIHPSIYSSTGFQMFVSSLSPNTSPHPPLLWSPQKRLIQEGWAGVSEHLLLCPMRCLHSKFLLLCCFYAAHMLTVQVAQSQCYQPNKCYLFSSL